MIYTILIILIVLVITLILILRNLARKYGELKYKHKSAFVKHGKSFEQLFPFIKNYGYDYRNFRFIGDPIDGLSFEDNKIVFIEFKTGGSGLSQKQRKIRDLIESKKVEWKEIREE